MTGVQTCALPISGYDNHYNDELPVSDDPVEVSVVNIDSENVENADEEIEQAIETTVEEIEAETDDSGNVISKVTNNFLSSIADVIMPSTTVKAADNVVVVLDPGHGGSDSGAVANSLEEKNITLKIAQYCKAELETYAGVTVYMTRESDESVGLEERVQKAKAWGADVFVSLHINSATNTSATGVEIWYPNSNYNTEIHNQGSELSNKILEQLTKLGLYNRGIHVKDSASNNTYADGSLADYYSVIRNSKLNGFPGIIVEHAFISNASDAGMLSQDSFLNQLGVADATGIANYFNLRKRSATTIKIKNINDFQGSFEVEVNSNLEEISKVVLSVWRDEDNSRKEYEKIGRAHV